MDSGTSILCCATWKDAGSWFIVSGLCIIVYIALQLQKGSLSLLVLSTFTLLIFPVLLLFLFPIPFVHFVCQYSEEAEALSIVHCDCTYVDVKISETYSSPITVGK